jgi:hypothetical protein
MSKFTLRGTGRFAIRGSLLSAFAAMATVACATEDVEPEETDEPVTSDDDTEGMGGNPGSETSAAGGTSGGAGAPVNGTGGSPPAMGAEGAVRCADAMEAMLLDFAPMAAADGGAVSTTTASFGDFSTTFSGGTYQYPPPDSMYPLTADMSDGDWHLTGEVGDYSGWGIFFNACSVLDASAFSGIQFTISGDIAMGGTVILNVGTAADDIGSEWLNDNTMPATPVAPNFGRCVPNATQYDGSCAAPKFSVAVTSTPTTITVSWDELLGGQPEESVNPAEITLISWSLPAPAGVGTAAVTPYTVDVRIDDIAFIP